MSADVQVNEKIFEPKDWEFTSPRDRKFTSDHLIDAYLSGKKEAENLKEKLIKDKLFTNIDLSGKYVKDAINTLRDFKINPINAYLRVNDWDDMNIIILIPEKDLLNKSIYDFYSFLSKFEEERITELFNFDISLCKGGEFFNEGKIFSDGYNFKIKL